MKMIMDMPTPAENARKQLCYLLLEIQKEQLPDGEALTKIHELLVEYDKWLVETADRMYALAVDSVNANPRPILIQGP